MELQIAGNCPSCGAPITVHEEDNLLLCPYCNVQNYMMHKGWPRLVVQPGQTILRQARPEQIMYVPYLRFKGTIFSCIDKTVAHNLIDTTRVAVKNARLPPSLGLRPQAMSLVPATKDLPGIFVRQQVESESVLQQALMLADLFSAKNSSNPVHRAFIGEKISRVYLPVYLQNGRLHDGLTSDVIATAPQDFCKEKNLTAWQPSWQGTFLSTLCPECGDMLAADRKSLVLFCRNCLTSWQEKGETLGKVDWGCLPARSENSLFLPFWQITCVEEKSRLTTFADFLAYTNQARVVTDQYRNQPLRFILPAFKINPPQFLQLARKATLAFPLLSHCLVNNMKTVYPVTLPETEAIQAIKTVIAYSAVAPEQVFSHLPAMQINVMNVRLLFLPFEDFGHDRIQPESKISIPAATLHYGRSL